MKNFISAIILLLACNVFNAQNTMSSGAAVHSGGNSGQDIVIGQIFTQPALSTQFTSYPGPLQPTLNTGFPTAIAQNITVNLDASGQATITPAMVDNGSSDTEGPVTLSLDRTTFDCSDAGVGVIDRNSISFNNGQLARSTNTSLPSGNAARTIEAWVYPTANGNQSFMELGNGTSNNQRFGLGRINNNLYFIGQFNDLNTNTFIPLNEWSHIAATHDGTTLRVYLNGVQVGSANKSFSTQTGDLILGGRLAGGERVIGKMAEVRYWNTALTASQIDTQRNQVLTGSESGLVAYFPFAEGSGATTSDLTGNGADLNVSNINTSDAWDTAYPSSVTLNSGIPVTLTVTDNTNNTATATAYVAVVDDTAPVITCSDDIVVTTTVNGPMAVTVPALQVNDNCISFNKSLNLDGAEYVQLPSIANTKALTMWVNLPASSNSGPWKYLLDARNGQSEGYFANLGIGSGISQMYVNGVSASKSWSNIPKDQWVHLYIEFASTHSDDINLFSRVSDNETLAGTIDEVGVWNGALTEAQVQGMMGAPIDPAHANLNAYYSFNQTGTGATLSDQTTSGHDATIVNHEADDWVAGKSFIFNSFNNTADASGDYPVGTTSVTWTATDSSGNVTTCSFDVTVDLDTPPTTIAQDVTVSLDANGQATITPAMVDNGSSDVEGAVTLSLDKTTFDCSDIASSSGKGTIDFTGGAGMLNLGNVDNFDNAYTFEAWIKTTNQNEQILFSKFASGVYGHFLIRQLSNGKIEASNDQLPDDVTVRPQSTSTINDGNWHHVAVSYGKENGSTGKIRIYIDGVLDGESVDQGIYTQGYRVNFIVGTRTDGVTKYVGQMDDVLIWNTQRSAAEILEDMKGNVVGSPLRHYDGSLTTVDQLTDQSSNAGHVDLSTIASTSIQYSGIPVNLSATDTANSVSTARSYITVEDNIAPVITCPEDLVITTTDANGAVVNYTEPSITDNCYTVPTIPAVSGYSPLGHYGNSYYYVSGIDYQYSHFLTDAADMGGYLVKIESAGENEYVRQLLAQTFNSQYAYIGATDAAVEGTFLWQDGTALTYSNWNSREPNNSGGNEDVALIRRDNGKWNDTNTAQNIRAIIEVPASHGRSAGFAIGENFPVGTTTVTHEWEIDGQAYSCSFDVTVNLDTPPTTIAQDVTVSLDANGQATITPAMVDNGSSDVEGAVTLSLDQTDFDCSYANGSSMEGAIHIDGTVSGTLNLGNVDNFTSAYTVESWVNTSSSSQQNLFSKFHSGVYGHFLIWQLADGRVKASNSVGPYDLSVQPESTTAINDGNWHHLAVSYGNDAATGGSNIKIYIDGALEATSVNQVINSQGSRVPFIIGTELSNSNRYGGQMDDILIWNTARTQAEILEDMKGNVVGNPLRHYNGSLTTVDQLTDQSTNSGHVDLSGVAAASVQYSGIPVNLTATDAANSAVSTRAYITVEDNIAPVITCLDDIMVTTTDANGAVVTYTEPSITDNCYTVPTVPAVSGYSPLGHYGDSYYYVSGIDKQYNAFLTDAANMGGYLVKIESAGENEYVRQLLAQTFNSQTAYIGATDSATEGTFLWQDGTPVTYTNWAAGEPNNVNDEDVVMILRNSGEWNDARPVLSSRAIIEVPASHGRSAGFASGENFPVGTTTVTHEWLLNGQTYSCSFDVTVDLDTPPTAIAQNITVDLDANGQATITPDMVDNGSSDVEGTITFSLDQTDFDCDDVVISPITVTLSVTDEANNTTTATALVTVEDNIAPIITCQNDVVLITTDPNGSIVNYTAPTITDLCATGGATLVADGAVPVSNGHGIRGQFGNSFYYIGYWNKSYNDLLADAAAMGGYLARIESDEENAFIQQLMNHGSASPEAYIGANDIASEANFVWQDGTALTYNNWATNHPINGGAAEDVAKINRSTGEWSNVSTNRNIRAIIEVPVTTGRTSGLASGEVFPVGTTTVTHEWLLNGQTYSCSFDVTVELDTVPTAIAQDITVNLDANGQATITPDMVDNGSSDVEGTVTLSLDQTDFDCNDVVNSPILVTLSVTDEANNTTTATALVTVEDNIAPVITLTGDAIMTLSVGNTYTEPGATATENCSPAAGGVVITGETVDTNTPGDYIITYNITDLSGNAATQVTRTVNVIDTIPSLNAVSIASDNVNSAFAKAGDTATISITGSTGLNNVTATIAGQTATVANTSGNDWTASYTFNGSEAEGIVSFTIDFESTFGTSGTQVTATTDSSSVTADFTAPVAVVQDLSLTMDDSGAASMQAMDAIVSVDNAVPANHMTYGSTEFKVLHSSSGNYLGFASGYASMNSTGNAVKMIAQTAVDTKVRAGDILYMEIVSNSRRMMLRNNWGSDQIIWEPWSSSRDASMKLMIEQTGTASGDPINFDQPFHLKFTSNNKYPLINSSGNLRTTTARNGSSAMTAVPESGHSFDNSIAAVASSVTTSRTSFDCADASAPVSVTITVSDAAGNSHAQDIDVTVADDEAPVISIAGLGDAYNEIQVGGTFTDPGASITDNCTVDMNQMVTTVLRNGLPTTFDASVQGSYTFNYNYTDPSGNLAEPVTRIVNVVDAAPPVLEEVLLSSNNTLDSNFARENDQITLFIRANKAIQLDNVTLNGVQMGNWNFNQINPATFEVYYTVSRWDDFQGPSTISINYSDIAGQAGTIVTTTTDGSNVIVDTIKPEATVTEHVQGGGTIAHPGDTAILVVDFDEPVSEDFEARVWYFSNDNLTFADGDIILVDAANHVYEVRVVIPTQPILASRGTSNSETIVGNWWELTRATDRAGNYYNHYESTLADNSPIMIVFKDADFVYENGAWTPNDPALPTIGSTANDRVEVRDGSVAVGSFEALDINVFNGATLTALPATTMTVHNDLWIDGILNYDLATVYYNAGDRQSYKLVNFSNSTIGTLEIGAEVGTLSIQGNLDITNVVKGHNINQSKLLAYDTASTVTLKSSATRTAMVDYEHIDFYYHPYTNINTSKVMVERWFSGVRKFRLMSSPISTSYYYNPNQEGATTIYDNWQEGGLLPGDAGYQDGMGTHITGTGGAANGFDVSGTNNPSLFGFDNLNNSWTTVTSTDQGPISAGTPYRILVRGDRSVAINTNSTVSIPTVLRTYGELFRWDRDFDVDSNAFNLIGNPYQAVYDILGQANDATDGSNIAGIDTDKMWIVDPTVTVQGGNYVSWDALLGATLGDFDGNIQPGQAVFFEGSGNGDSQITLQKKYAVTSIAPLTTVYSNNGPVVMHLKLRDSNSADLDGSIIGFDASFSNAIDNDDSVKFLSNSYNLARTDGSSYLSIERRELPVDGETLPLYVTVDGDGGYSLNMAAVDFGNINAYLVDNLTNTSTLMSNTTQTNYAFSVAAGDAVDVSQRFEIRFEDGTLSAGDIAFAKAVTLYPNPAANGYVNIDFDGILGEKTITILNLLGQSVNTFETNETGIYRLNDLDLKTGTYLVEIKTDLGEQTEKLVME
ncbi:MAG: LamG-like jellyroll fold domain-containing protein [Nonlabens sp.]